MKVKGTQKLGEAAKRKKEAPTLPSFLPYFVFPLSQFSGPDYLGAWNRLQQLDLGCLRLPDIKIRLFILSLHYGRPKVILLKALKDLSLKNICGRHN